MKSAKPSSPKVRRRDGKSSIHHSKSVRQRGFSLNLESLEQRTLLSISSSTDQTLSKNANPVSLVPVTKLSENLPSSLQKSVADFATVATVAAPSETATSLASSIMSHIYTGQPTTFTRALDGEFKLPGTSSSGPRSV